MPDTSFPYRQESVMVVLTEADARLPYTTREVAEKLGMTIITVTDDSGEMPVTRQIVTTNAAQKALKRLRAAGKVEKTDEGRWMATQEQYTLYKSGAGSHDNPHRW